MYEGGCVQGVAPVFMEGEVRKRDCVNDCSGLASVKLLTVFAHGCQTSSVLLNVIQLSVGAKKIGNLWLFVNVIGGASGACGSPGANKHCSGDLALAYASKVAPISACQVSSGSLPGRRGFCSVKTSCAGRSAKSSQQNSRRRPFNKWSRGCWRLARHNTAIVLVSWWVSQQNTSAAGSDTAREGSAMLTNKGQRLDCLLTKKLRSSNGVAIGGHSFVRSRHC